MKEITVKQYLELDYRQRIPYDALLCAIRKKAWHKVDLNQITYNEVKNIHKRIQKAKEEKEVVELFTYAFKIQEFEILDMPIHKFFQLKKYLIDFFVFLTEREQLLLRSVDADSVLWEAAGGNTLNEFSDVLPLSQLAKIYGGYPFDYGEKKYIEIITLLRMNNKQASIEKEYQRLISKR